MKILVAASNMMHIKNFHLPYIEKFREAGNEVYVMAGGEGADYDIPFKKRAFSFKNFLLSFKIRKILKKERFDAVYLHTTLAAFWVRFAMWGLKRKSVVVNTVHGYLFSKNTSRLKAKIYLFAEKLMKSKTDYIAVMNKEDFNVASENKLCKKEVFQINGMGAGLFERSTDYNSRANGILRLTYVGELSDRKNQLFLIKALKRLDNAHLTLVGDGDIREELENAAREYGVFDRLTVTGFTKNVKEYLENTDIYVSASVIEGLPFNILEAMALEIPIVASDIKGQSDLLPRDTLYPFGNEDAYVALVESTVLAPRYYGVEKYKFENAFPQNMNLYLKILEGQS